jgi:hypothetical protein
MEFKGLRSALDGDASSRFGFCFFSGELGLDAAPLLVPLKAKVFKILGGIYNRNENFVNVV